MNCALFGGYAMFRLLLLLTVLSVSSLACAQLPVQPQTPAPDYSVARVLKGDEVLLSYVMIIHEVQTREKVQKKDGVKERVKYTVRVPRMLRKYKKRKLSDLTITNAAGKLQEENVVREAWRKPTIVLISSDGNKVDPYYLKIVKPDTLVVVDKTVTPDNANQTR